MAKSDVTVTIDLQKPTPKIGFGKPLILGSSTAGAAYKTYLDLDAVKIDFAASTEEYKAAAALFGQGDNSPREIAIMCRKTGATAQTIPEIMANAFLKDWFFIVTTSNLIADLTAIADAVEADGMRMFFARVSDKADLATLKAKKYKQTVAFLHTDLTKYPEAAWIGRTASADVGSVTWKFKTLTGIAALDLTSTEIDEIHNLGANTYVTKAGDDVTSEGKTISGEYIDIIHAKAYIKSSIEYAVQKLLNSRPKVSYDDNGISQIESVVLAVLQRADNQGLIAKDSDGLGIYSTNFKGRADVDPADREKRIYNGGEFTFELAGAIHETKIRGVIKL